jgi:hypothetical protein
MGRLYLDGSLKKIGIDVKSQDIDHWRALVNVALNLQVS